MPASAPALISGRSPIMPSALTPRKWQETKDSIRQCQALSGGADNPDLISLIGFEWTQSRHDTGKPLTATRM